MTNDIKQRLAKIYELVNRGATEGERSAAKAAMDRLMQKYNITQEALQDIHLHECVFTITSYNEEKLLTYIMRSVNEKVFADARKGTKKVIMRSTYMEYVEVDCMYEYFRKHMKTQWSLTCAPQLKKCRKIKSRNELRHKLQKVFLIQYLVKSGLVPAKEVVRKEVKSNAEYKRRMMVDNVEGGKYNKQMHTNLMIEN